MKTPYLLRLAVASGTAADAVASTVLSRSLISVMLTAADKAGAVDVLLSVSFAAELLAAVFLSFAGALNSG